MYCVIMGDIINSRGIEDDEREGTMRAVRDVLEGINVRYGDVLMADFGLVRGDAFEGVLLSRICAPRLVRDIIRGVFRAGGIRVRVSVVSGELLTRSSDRNEVNGPAFYKAADDLGRMKSSRKESFIQISFDTNSVAAPVVDSLFELMDSIAGKWTGRQREIAFLMEDFGGNRSHVAKELEISAQAVGKHLASLGYVAYDNAWKGLEALLVGLDESAVSGTGTKARCLPLYGLAERRLSMDDPTQASAMFTSALELAQAEFGENSPEFIHICIRLAECLLQLGERQSARDYAGRALRLMGESGKVNPRRERAARDILGGGAEIE